MALVVCQISLIHSSAVDGLHLSASIATVCMLSEVGSDCTRIPRDLFLELKEVISTARRTDA